MGSNLNLTYLGSADIQACAISSREVTEAVHSAFEALSEGRAVIEPQLEMVVDASLDFKAKGGVLISERIAAVKWYGFAAGNPEAGLPSFIPLIILNELPTGRPIAVMDGHWISGVRTAALSTVAARALADPQSHSIGFIGAGLQAISHLDALRDFFPLRKVLAHTRTRASAQRFLEYATSLGLQADWSDDPQLAVRGHSIVVSSIPRLTERPAFLDAAWLAPGSFVALVDAGRAWKSESLQAIDYTFTDHLSPTTGRPLETLFYDGAFAGQLSDLVKLAGQVSDLPTHARKAMVFGGSGLADTAVAALVYRHAIAQGRGTQLPL